MAIGRGALEDWLIQTQMQANAAWGQIHRLRHGALNRGLIDITRAMCVGIDRQRLGHANRIGQLNSAAICKTRSHHVFRQIARRIGG